MKPNFMLIGASKCATSTLSSLLSQHPDIFMITKETMFFCDDEIYSRGLDWYKSLYKKAEGYKKYGERNNLYSMKEVFPYTVSRLIDYNPDMKIIYCVRNPIERIESYWLQIRSHGGEQFHYDFNTSVRVNRDWLVDASNYWQQINVYRSHFPDDKILIIFLEDFKSDQKAVMDSCFKFLDVDPKITLSKSLHLNPSRGKTIPRNTLSHLRQYSVFRSGVRLIPQELRNFIKNKLLFKKVDQLPQWNPETRKWVIDLLQNDTYKFLEYYGKHKNFWNLNE